MARIRFLDQVPIGVFATPASIASTTGSFSGSFFGVFTGSLFGTASYAESSSYALTASYALNGGGEAFRITSASYTASVGGGYIFLINSSSANILTINDYQSVIISSSANNILQLNNTNNTTVLNVSQSGILTLSTQSIELTGSAPNGGVYFTSASFYVGLS